ncbi:hypothetical protein [Thalassomonas haliotis]|uniref:Uncharacterized protein n=1 Tax=Thalassomonas haliotis TaxID=485448 RepID=A0ABY7V766_9GAMM|nr:hypothetical protein [Thalassomonas haliotis]WDE09508.1 hypothetical protein H3N35_14290 [Thalassomonas haliotis]
MIKNVIDSHFDEANDCYTDLLATDNSRQFALYRHRQHQRLMANLEGLVLSGDYGWSLCRECLKSDAISAGEHFVIAFLAFELNDIPCVKDMLGNAFANRDFFKATSDALCWRNWQQAQFWASQFSRSETINAQLLGLQAFRYHQKQAPLSLAKAVETSFNGRQQAALDFLLSDVITDKDIELLPVLTPFITGDLSAGNFTLICKCINLQGFHLFDRLQPFISRENINQEKAVAFVFSRITEPKRSQWLNLLKARPNAIRLLLIAIGAMAESRYLDWVIKQMDDPEHARLAGKTFSLLTGIDLDEKGWLLNDAGLDPAWLAYDFDEALDWPDKSQIIAARSTWQDNP